MKNIPHLEDLGIYADPSETKEIMAALYFRLSGEKVGELSIKYDGAPLVVFGKDIENRFFVTNKAYHNKTRIVYYSEDEIWASKLAEGLKEKLALVYECFEEAARGWFAGKVVFADFLFMNAFGKKTDYSFQPNIIKYDSITSLRDYTLGLALHGQTYCEARIETPTSLDCTPGHQVFFADMRPSIEWSKLPLVRGKMNNMIYPPEDLGVDVKAMRSILNQIVKGNTAYRFSQLKPFAYATDNIQTNLKTLIEYKYAILDLLNGPHNRFPFKMSIDGVRTTHEGYVFKYHDHAIKLVDRYVFSKKNFDQATSRGWTK